MWSHLLLLHSTDFCEPILEDTRFFEWRTCQRIVRLTDTRLWTTEERFPFLNSWDSYEGYDAYQFLLEIVSGLRSRLFGETEIQHQFQTRFQEEFLRSVQSGEAFLRLRDQILEHSKHIRRLHLRGLGRKTYGSIAEKHLTPYSAISILGTGKLAESILTYLNPKKKQIHVIGRNQDRLKELQTRFGVAVGFWEDEEPNTEANVIVTSFLPLDWETKLKNSGFVLDFRENAKLKHSNLIGLDDMLNSLSQIEANLQAIKMDILFSVTELTRRREEERLVFVHGWEDLPCERE